MFEERLMALEGAEECIAVGSGMAAVNTALLANVKAGDRVVGARAMFASCLWILDTLLPRLGVEVIWVDGDNLDQWREAAKKPIKLALIETPSNPVLGAVDIAAVADIVHKAGGWLIVDNVFASVVLQKPLALGADVVVYSATKHIDGQGRCLGGIVLGSQAYVKDHLHNFLKHTGPSLSPFNAWVMLKGLETLNLRVRAQCAMAATLADHLAEQRGVRRVLYCGRTDFPQAALAKRQMKGFGQVVTFELDGGKEAAFRFLNALRLVKISNNLGDAKSLITHPATTTHQRLGAEARAQLGISDGMLRLSVGLEAVVDLTTDIDRALAASRIG
jgi:O-succinylhomoserine sulfhydrylase